MRKKSAPLLVQVTIYAAILFVSSLISFGFEKLVPNFPLPTPLVGLVILYSLLSLGIVKIQQVERLSRFLIGIISLIFIPSGIALVSQLEVMRSEGAAIVTVVILSTVLMLGVTAGITYVLIQLKNKIRSTGRQTPEQETE